jgi:hypothetical protein
LRKWIDIDGNTVLQALLDHSGLAWPDLCRTLGFEPNASHPGPMALYSCVVTLHEAGLVTADGIPDQRFRDFLQQFLYGYRRPGAKTETKIRASESWRKVQMALEMRFLGARRLSKASMTVYPNFGAPLESRKAADIFVVMPFSEHFLSVYLDFIRPCIEALGLTIERADDIFSGNQIMQDVWEAICGAGALVADCTGRNPNVFYEIGIAHTIGKPVILLSQDPGDLPADLRSYKFFLYEQTPVGLHELQEKISGAVSGTFGLYW